MSTVVARFKLQEITQVQGWETKYPVLTRVKLTAIQGEPFGSATPWGTIEMQVANPDAAAQFHLGTVYQVQFDAVETP